MREITPGNQIICATHSADLIDEAGRENTFLLRRLDDGKISCQPATKDDAVTQSLRDMFGYSGFIGLARKLVFIEGDKNSADRKTFINLFPDLAQEIRLIPVGSVDNIYRINRAALVIVEAQFGYGEAFFIRDRDYLSASVIAAHQERGRGKLFILERKEIENYLLDEHLIAELLKRIFGQNSSATEVRQTLLEIARKHSASTLRDMVVARYQELYQSEDCSIGNHSSNQPLIDEGGTPVPSRVENLSAALLEKLRQVNSVAVDRTNEASVTKIFESCKTEVIGALNPKLDVWKRLFSGKVILEEFSERRGLGDWPALQNLIIESMSGARERIPQDLTRIFQAISGAGAAAK